MPHGNGKQGIKVRCGRGFQHSHEILEDTIVTTVTRWRAARMTPTARGGQEPQGRYRMVDVG